MKRTTNLPTEDKDKALRNLVATSPWGVFFGVSQQTFDLVWRQLTSSEGNSVTYISMEIGADMDVFNPVRDKLNSMHIEDSTNPQLDYFITKYLKGPQKIPNYGGGLGILAGDTLKSFADLRIPVVAVSLLYRKGYFSQLVDSQLGQIAWSREWHPEDTPSLFLLKDPHNPDRPLTIEIPFYDRNDKIISAFAHVWMKMEVNSHLDFFIPEILLDYSIAETPDWIRQAARNLYDASSERSKAIQRRLLGSSITTVMKTLGLTSGTIHLNEQHGVVLVLHLIAEKLQGKYGEDYTMLATDEDIIEASSQVAEMVVYTIHTPVKAGHDRFEKNMYAELGHSFCQRVLHLLAQDVEFPEFFNFTALAMKVNRATNSVSRLHKLVTQRQFPQFSEKITAVTNGVHHTTWISDRRADLYSSFSELENWQNDPGVFANTRLLRNNTKFIQYFEQTLQEDTQALVEYVNAMLISHRNQMQTTWIDPPNYLSHLPEKQAELNAKHFTIGFARRFSTYKRAALIFEDPGRLADIVQTNNTPVNFIFAGKAHPSDEPGKMLIKQVLDIQEALYRKSNGLIKVVFIPDYDMSIAKMMVAGVNAWLNSPKRPLEASGTSGMKAALNGVPNISIMDGWWVEGYHEGQTGWKFGYESPVQDSCFSEAPDALLYAEDAASFYQIFPDILQTFYNSERRREYIDKCIMNLTLNNPIFNTHRMAAEYIEKYRLKLSKQATKRIEKFAALYRSDSE
jgi:starch phosphorylase